MYLHNLLKLGYFLNGSFVASVSQDNHIILQDAQLIPHAKAAQLDDPLGNLLKHVCHRFGQRTTSASL